MRGAVPSHQAGPGFASGAVTVGPEARRKVSLLVSLLEGDRASVFPGNGGGGAGQHGRECCPGLAVSWEPG